MPPSRQIPHCQWYIGVEVAIMEICGRSHDYFSRVKAADKNKTLGKLPTAVQPTGAKAGLSADFMGFSALMPGLGKYPISLAR
ncbi:hypothetical protein LMTR13_03450 [Bradyrhizobium icense]|uniref:Uncharacterized protein n=1 Tax=Bradyrhizobium icense TaxID=1274631 RepID=A0A1B1U9C5_9BRAD|nr:hypothetical protein LMTR13_03450 [Bradyrhizobium icense]